jgi:nucleoside phosphorylase
MSAIRVREELPATSLTIKGSGVLSGEEFKKLTAFARTQNPEMNTATCIVNSSSEGKSFTQARALCDRIAASNLNIKTTMFENRSTVQGSAIFARVVFGSEE